MNTIMPIFIAFLLFAGCPITLNVRPENTTAVGDYTLKQIIDGESCDAACWQSIEPGVWTVDDVDALLEEREIEPYVVHFMEHGRPMTYEWDYVETVMLPDPNELLGGVLVSFTEKGTVIQVTLLVDFCVETVIDHIGIPELIVERHFETMMVYPSRNIMFVMDDLRVDAMYKVPDFELPTVGEITWESFKRVLDEECTDKFS